MERLLSWGSVREKQILWKTERCVPGDAREPGRAVEEAELREGV